jgi:hypothetical protein
VLLLRVPPPCQAVRHQAAAVTAALALSSPPLLAVLFGECLEGVETFCQQLMLLAAPYTKRGAAPVPASGSAHHQHHSSAGVRRVPCARAALACLLQQ